MGLNKLVKTQDLYTTTPSYLTVLFESSEYPWEMLPKINKYAWSLIEKGIDGYTAIATGVLVGENVKIYPNVIIEPPAIIGSNSEVRPGAFIRGSVITGEGCVIGNSSELKNCILLDKVQIPHYNYVGDSVLGNRAHTGAGTICSNLKSDGKPVVIHGDQDYETGLRKVGGILADGADIGCGSVINPGTVIGKNTSVYPLTALRGVYPADSIVKETNVIVKRKTI
ncbi:MAG: UDP-N-acetylglucosamine pyrophosphorylase [Clostridia bacterium]|nr:UDP-N-acetylglucosamine pyrophosphorylase [Clostridia bacterium]MBO7304317.1 UDP-N-acetylglucosamine pyrophosphorylase [Clostridia bacterium]